MWGIVGRDGQISLPSGFESGLRSVEFREMYVLFYLS